MKKSILLCAALAALTACNGNSDNNKSLDYETIDVNFTLKSDLEIPEGTEFGVVALCARDGQQGVNMGEKPVASYKVSGTASPQRLAASSEEDKIQARESDHGFSFYAVSPYKNNVDVSAMQVSLPARQNYSDGIIKYLPILAVKNAVSVLPDVEFDVKTPFSVLNLSVPADIVEEGVPATLKSLSFKPSDGVVPVTFPVVFPLGVENGVKNFTAETQPKWVSTGYWSCPSQPQAYCQWNKVSDPSDKYQQKLETVNSGKVSSPGVKGVWTGDNFEFVIPVKQFAAGTSLTVKFPIYGRQQPVFWNIKYLDGEEWKIVDKQMIVSNDPNYSMECSFAMKRGGIVVEKTMKFENAIKSGFIHVKVECADGSIQASADATFTKRTMPYTDSKGYGAPFYLYCADSGVNSVSFSIE